MTAIAILWVLLRNGWCIVEYDQVFSFLREMRGNSMRKQGNSVVAPNPEGRRLSMQLLIKELCGHDGQKLVEFAFKLLEQQKFFGKRIRVQDRQWAVEFLADRGWGKSVQQQEITLSRTQFVFHDDVEALPPVPEREVLPAGIAHSVAGIEYSPPEGLEGG